MITDLKWPRTNKELAELIGAEGQYVFEATMNEYWEVMAEAEYRADYYDQKIIATMSYENETHSHLAAEFGFLLKTIFRNNDQYRVYNSNRPVYIPNCPDSGSGVFNADGMVIALPAQRFEYQKGMNAEMNPIILVEVLSKSTRLYDFGTKLPCYKNIPSLRQIIYVEQDSPKVYLFERTAPNRWLETSLEGFEATFSIEQHKTSLESIYRGLTFTA